MRRNICRLSLLCALFSFIDAYGHIDFAEKTNFISICLEQPPDVPCEQTRLKILNNYYKCSVMGDFNGIPKRIRSDGIDLYAKIGEKNYMYDWERESFIETSDEFDIDPAGSIEDKNYNIYTVVKGNIYGIEGRTSRRISIHTGRYHSNHQIAIDNNSSGLFILDLNAERPYKNRFEGLFVLDVNNFGSGREDSVTAMKIDEVNGMFTSLAVHEDKNLLLLGIKQGEGGKIIQLKGEQEDPCVKKVVENKKTEYYDDIRMTSSIMNSALVALYDKYFSESKDNTLNRNFRNILMELTDGRSKNCEEHEKNITACETRYKELLRKSMKLGNCPHQSPQVSATNYLNPKIETVVIPSLTSGANINFETYENTGKNRLNPKNIPEIDENNINVPFCISLTDAHAISYEIIDLRLKLKYYETLYEDIFKLSEADEEEKNKNKMSPRK